ncbi:MAG: SDR family oxidoreductase [Bacteroidales bacterium]|nr:SDR family oxidoreductase [Bacteroidales bacterium]MBQ2913765.1 SDR family oxidoreductase [Bacteroidales bacterium]
MEHYILITGASSGMGALCAKHFSISHRLILASENMEMLESVCKECANSEKHILWLCNFATDREYIAESLTNFLKMHDAVVDKYVHFAGITRLLPLKTFSIPNIDLIFNVNFFSILEIIKVLLKKTNAKALNNVVLISAMVSERGNIGNSIYAASKGAINSLVYTLARELAPEIRINALMPGAIDTPMSANLDEAYKEEMRRDTPLGWGTPQDVVDYVDFLFSNKSKWITGQTLFVDGGRSTK